MFGLAGSITWTAVAAATARFLQQADVSDNFEFEELTDGLNDVQGTAASGQKTDVSITLIPVATSGGNTQANAQLATPFPPKGATITLAAMDDTSLNGTYIYMGGGRKAMVKNKYLVQVLPLRQYPTAGAITPVTWA